MAFLAPVGALIASAFGTSGFLATTTAVAGATGAAITGASLLNSPKVPKQTTTPIVTPTPAASLVDAQAAADARRRTSILTGGVTNRTGGAGALLGFDQVKKKTLLGE